MNWMLNLYWASGSDFLAMGGYGLYVWGSFGVTALVMAGELLMIRHRRRALGASLATPGIDSLGGESGT